jgi:hypothetical protein
MKRTRIYWPDERATIGLLKYCSPTSRLMAVFGLRNDLVSLQTWEYYVGTVWLLADRCVTTRLRQICLESWENRYLSEQTWADTEGDSSLKKTYNSVSKCFLNLCQETGHLEWSFSCFLQTHNINQFRKVTEWRKERSRKSRSSIRDRFHCETHFLQLNVLKYSCNFNKTNTELNESPNDIAEKQQIISLLINLCHFCHQNFIHYIPSHVKIKNVKLSL